MNQDIEGALDYLNTPAQNTDKSVIQHVSQVLLRVTDFGADRPIDYFEPFSYIVKEEQRQEQVSMTEELLALHEKIGPDFQQVAHDTEITLSHLFPRSKLTAEGEEEEDDAKDEEQEAEEEEKHEEEEMQNEGEVPNVPSDMRYVSTVGIGLTSQETFLLQQAIQKLVRTKPLATARFWGKVIGVEKNYYICEVEYNEGERPQPEANEEEEKDENNEEKEKEPPIEEASGPNLFNYFVCNELGSKWVLLPDVLPKQIVASRSIKQMFTGNLNAEVIAPPGRFNGTEKELLRCFIARVVHCCTLAPKGQYNPEEEPEEDMPLESNAPIVMDEEWEGKPIKGVESFVHRMPCILPQGRTEFWAPETEEEDGKEPEVEKGVPILTPITEDEPIEGGIPSWSWRILRGGGPRFWLRSNVWPGLHVVSSEKGDRMVMMYFGWGMKATAPLEWPPLPEKKKVPEEEEEEEEEKREEEDVGEAEAEPPQENVSDDDGSA